MKIVIALTLLVLLSLSGCDDKNNNSNSSHGPNVSNSNSNNNGRAAASFTPPIEIKPEAQTDPNFKSCNSYFPLVPGSQAKYNLIYPTTLRANVNVVVEQGTGQDNKPVMVERTQIVDSSGGLHKNSLGKELYSCDGEKVDLVGRLEDNDVEGNKAHIEIRYSRPAVAMVEPSAMVPGTSWTYSFTETFQQPGQATIDTNKTYRVSMSVIGPQDVTVPAGTFKTMKLEKKTETSTIYEYYARGIGLVKREMTDGTTWELREFSGLKEQP